MLLLLAGNETTTNLIGNGTLALGRHPEQMRMLRGRCRSMLPRAIEEMLRYDGPVQSTARSSKTLGELADINPGGTSVVFVILAAANRDPGAVPRAGSLRYHAKTNDHLAFGEGIHFCIGARWRAWRRRSRSMLMLERFPKLRLADAGCAAQIQGFRIFCAGWRRCSMAIR